MKNNYYQLLQINSNATLVEIKSTYRDLAKKYHPDKNPGKASYEQKFKLITEAYATLSNPEKRRRYDLRYKYIPPQSRNDYSSARWRRYKSRRQFSKEAIIKGNIFIIVLVIVVVMVPVLLNYYSSRYNYNEGIRARSNNDYLTAMVHFRRSMVLFGNKSFEAGLAAAKLKYYYFKNPSDALFLINQAVEYAKTDEEFSKIHYLKGRIFQEGRDYESARTELLKSVNYSQVFDSAYYYLGEINSFAFQNYAQGVENFNQLLKLSPDYTIGYFARGYCFQKLDDHENAISDFDNYLKAKPRNGQVFLYKAISELTLNRVKQACEDLITAENLGISDAAAYIIINCQPPN